MFQGRSALMKTSKKFESMESHRLATLRNLQHIFLNQFFGISLFPTSFRKFVIETKSSMKFQDVATFLAFTQPRTRNRKKNGGVKFSRNFVSGRSIFEIYFKISATSFYSDLFFTTPTFGRAKFVSRLTSFSTE